MDMAQFEKLRDTANNDPEFRIAARLWNSALRLGMGETGLLIHIKEGQITEILTGRQAFEFLVPANITVAAPAEEWQKFLEPVPKPFYNDLWGAVARHGFTVGGDMETFYAYYPAIRRLFDIMRSIAPGA
jgi:hypothetical protein